MPFLSKRVAVAFRPSQLSTFFLRSPPSKVRHLFVFQSFTLDTRPSTPHPTPSHKKRRETVERIQDCSLLYARWRELFHIACAFSYLDLPQNPLAPQQSLQFGTLHPLRAFSQDDWTVLKLHVSPHHPTTTITHDISISPPFTSLPHTNNPLFNQFGNQTTRYQSRSASVSLVAIVAIE